MLISLRNTLTDVSRIMFDQIAGHCSELVKSRRKINHHNGSLTTLVCFPPMRVLISDKALVNPRWRPSADFQGSLCISLLPRTWLCKCEPHWLSPWTCSFVSSSTQGVCWAWPGPPLPAPQTRNSLQTASGDYHWICPVGFPFLKDHCSSCPVSDVLKTVVSYILSVLLFLWLF